MIIESPEQRIGVNCRHVNGDIWGGLLTEYRILCVEFRIALSRVMAGTGVVCAGYSTDAACGRRSVCVSCVVS